MRARAAVCDGVAAVAALVFRLDFKGPLAVLTPLCALAVFHFTHQKALYDIGIFAIGFGIVVYGFGFAGFLLFGHALIDAHSIPASTSSLARFVLGESPDAVKTDAPSAPCH